MHTEVCGCTYVTVWPPCKPSCLHSGVPVMLIRLSSWWPCLCLSVARSSLYFEVGGCSEVHLPGSPTGIWQRQMETQASVPARGLGKAGFFTLWLLTSQHTGSLWVSGEGDHVPYNVVSWGRSLRKEDHSRSGLGVTSELPSLIQWNI